MQTSLSELGVNSQAMTFQEMLESRKRKQEPVIPAQSNEQVRQNVASVPDAPPGGGTMYPHPGQGIPPMEQGAPLAMPAAMPPAMPRPVMAAPGQVVAQPQVAAPMCMPKDQKELIALMVLAFCVNTPYVKEKLSQVSIFKDNSIMNAVGIAAIVTGGFFVIRRVM